MQCENIHKYFTGYYEKTLSPEDLELVSNHLDFCNSCRALYNFYQESMVSIDAEKDIELNPYFYTRLEQKLENITNQPSTIPTAKIVFQRLQPLLATVIITVCVLFGAHLGKKFSESYLITSTGESQEVYLEDELFPGGLTPEPVEYLILADLNGE